MGGKGTTTQSQAYTPNATVAGAGSQAISMAQSAASTPFQTPAAPVAPFSQDQNNAFQGVRDTQGMAQPYLNTAANYMNQSAAPITGSQVANYYNPMAQNVFAAQNDLFGHQMQQTTGQLTQAAGGVGASRIGVGQSELARQQGLAQGQTAASLYQPALAAAQQDAQRQANAGYGFESLGPTAQNAALQGSGALLNTGGLQQQETQAQLNSPYQQQLAQLAYPFQTAQFLSGVTGQQAPVFGGTTETDTTKPPPSIWSQIGGAGLAAAGLFTGNPALIGSGIGMGTGGGGKGSGPVQSGTSPSQGGANVGYGANGQSFNWGYASGGAVSPFDAGGHFATGGTPDFGDPNMPFAYAPPDQAIPQGQPLGGATPFNPTQPMRINNAFKDANAAAANGSGILQGGPTDFANTPLETPPNPLAAIPNATQPASDMAYQAPAQIRSAQASNPMAASDAPDPAAEGIGKLPYDEPTKDAGNTFARSPQAALVAAGLGIMAGDSPYAGINIGKGGLEGIKELENQRKATREEQNVNMAAKRLAQEAQFHLDQYNKMTPVEQARTDLEKEKLARELWKPTGTFDPQGRPLLFNQRDGTTKIAGAPDSSAVTAPPAVEDAAKKDPTAPIIDLSPTVVNSLGLQGPVNRTGPERTAQAREAIQIKKETRAASESARGTQFRLDEMSHALSSLPDTGALAPGALVGERLAAAKTANTIADAFGLKKPFDPNTVGSLEEAEKVKIIGGFLQSRLTGGGQHNAATIVQTSMKAFPGADNTPMGAKLIIASAREAAQSDRDRHEFLVRNEQKFQGNLNAADVAFQHLNPPEKYAAKARLSVIPPQYIDYLKTHRDDPAAVASFEKKYGSGLLPYLGGS